jgi:membrane fusion protein (multidrug efflux system)
VNSAKAQLTSAEAAHDNAQADFDRVNALQAKAVASTASLDTARSALAQSTAGVAAAQAGVTLAQANADVAVSAKTEAERTLDEDKLAADQAQLNLDHAVVRAPFDGVVGNGAVQPGEYIQPGQRLLALVPLEGVYVVANFKETQVAEIQPGMSVKVTVDAYPGMPITGTVESVAPASGSVFSLLPPENATGNFTKIVQRVPVRIRLPQSVADQGIIRPGMSIVVSVDSRTTPAPVASR